MATPNFTLTNQWFALSPMVLHAKMEPGTNVTLSIIVTNTGETINIILNADTTGNVVYDMAPIVRDIISRNFLRENIKGYSYSPYGLTLTTKLNNTYSLYHSVVWARASAPIVNALYNEYRSAWLLPTGKYTYRRDAPVELLTTFAMEEMDNTIVAKNRKTGTTYDVSGQVIYAPYNIPSSLFDELPNGDYDVYLNNPGNMVLSLTVTDGCFPTDALKDRKMAYVRFCNQWGGISYALLKITKRSTKNKGTYVQKAYALDADPKSEKIYSVYPDRVMTGQEITQSFKAGKDQLSISALEELQSILVSPMVDMYDADTGEWVPVYPGDATVTETNDALQEITIDFNMNTEGF